MRTARLIVAGFGVLFLAAASLLIGAPQVSADTYNESNPYRPGLYDTTCRNNNNARVIYGMYPYQREIAPTWDRLQDPDQWYDIELRGQAYVCESATYNPYTDLRIIDISDSTGQGMFRFSSSTIFLGGANRPGYTEVRGIGGQVNLSQLSEGCHNYQIGYRAHNAGNGNHYSDGVSMAITLCYRKPAPPWEITPSVSVDRSTAAPGNRITWTHGIKNTGSAATNTSISYRSQSSNGLSGNGGWWTRASGLGVNGEASQNSTYDVTQDNVGNTLCRATGATPKTASDSSQVTSGEACVSVPYNYTLTPTIQLDRSDVIEVGTPIVATPAIGNSGPTKTRTTQWQISRVVVDKGQAIPNTGGGSSSNAPCGNYFNVAGQATCENVRSGNTVFNTSGGRLSGDDFGGNTSEAADLEVGTRICYALSVKDRAANDSNWQHSALVCLVVGKKPKVQVTGGDIRVGAAPLTGTAPNASNISTSQSFRSNTTYGSWGEYGIAATGTVVGIGSGASLNKGIAAATLCSYTLITFTNAGSTTCSDVPTIGEYKTMAHQPNVAGGFSVSSSDPALSGDVDVSSIVGTRFRGGGPISLVTAELPLGRSVIINAPTQTVTIKGNLTYTQDEATGLNDIPQLIIIANNINIESGVTQVDAWLVARAVVNTCSDVVRANVTSETCNNALTVNGPVVTNRLLLYRTAGSGTGDTIGDPAEVFNLRPDAYLWGLQQKATSGRLETTYERELPPRY